MSKYFVAVFVTDEPRHKNKITVVGTVISRDIADAQDHFEKQGYGSAWKVVEVDEI